MNMKRLLSTILISLLLVPALLFAAGTKDQAKDSAGDGIITLSVYHFLDQTDKTTAPNFQ